MESMESIDKPLLGDVRCMMFAWVLNHILLGDGFSGSFFLGDADFGDYFTW